MIATKIDIRAARGLLQGYWLTDHPNDSGILVSDLECSVYKKDGDTVPTPILIRGEHLRLHDWILSEVNASHAIWSGGPGGVQVTWSRPDLAEPPKKIPRLHSPPLTSKMKWGDPDEAEFTDAIISGGDGHELAVHRNVLAAASPVFQKAFSSHMREGLEMKIIIADASTTAVHALLAFIYEGTLDPTQAIPLLPLAHRYELMDLVARCASCIVDNLTVETLVDAIVALKPFVAYNENVRHAWEKAQQLVCRNPDMLNHMFSSVGSS